MPTTVMAPVLLAGSVFDSIFFMFIFNCLIVSETLIIISQTNQINASATQTTVILVIKIRY